MESTQRTIILIKAQALQEASDYFKELDREAAEHGDFLIADRYNFAAAVTAGRAADLTASTQEDDLP